MNTTSILGVVFFTACTGYMIIMKVDPDDVEFDFFGCKFKCKKHNAHKK